MRRISMLWAVLALAGGHAVAQGTAPPPPPSDPLPPAALTLAEAIAEALRRHPELAAARRELEAAAAAREQAGVLPNPVLGVELEDTRRETRTTTVLLTQPIELGGKRASRVAAAAVGESLADAQLASRRIEVRAAVTAAFFEALVAGERVRLGEASLQLARSASEAVAKRVGAGRIPPIDDTKARVVEAGVRLELEQARSRQQIGLQRLRAAMGNPGAPADRLEGRLDSLPPPVDFAELDGRLEGSPAIRQARLETERQGTLAVLERARRMPDLSISLGAMRSQEDGRTKAVIGLSMPLPVFDRNDGALREALRREDKAREEAKALVLRARADAFDAHRRQAALRAELDVLRRDVLPGAQAAFEAAATGFQLGKFGYLDVLDAQRTLFDARVRHLQVLAEAHRAVIDLDRLLGDPADAAATPQDRLPQ